MHCENYYSYYQLRLGPWRKKKKMMMKRKSQLIGWWQLLLIPCVHYRLE